MSRMYVVSYDGCIGRRLVQAPFSHPSTHKYLKVRLSLVKFSVRESISSLNNPFIHIVHSIQNQKEKKKEREV